MENDTPKQNAENWSATFEKFLTHGCKQNATFAMHVDMMRHCSHVLAISLSERIGGVEGHSLLMAVVKDSLPFSFVNNASSYAPFCVKLLYHHKKAGFFHQCLKQTLYSTPFRESTRNFACDTKRELDHIEALKSFRSGSNMNTVTSRMSMIDNLNDTRAQTSRKKSATNDNDCLGWGLTDVDEKHIIPTTSMILRQGGLSIHESHLPVNLYSKVHVQLPPSILDAHSIGTGKYLILRYISQECMFGLTEADLPTIDDVSGAKELISRARRSKGVTIKRTVKSKKVDSKTERQIKEEHRQKKVAKQTKLADCFASDNNTCQALLKPDSTKPKVIKSIGMQKALKSIIAQSLPSNEEEDVIDSYMNLNVNAIPRILKPPMKLCVVEFAGMKFKLSHAKSGNEYLKLVEQYCRNLIRGSSDPTLIICEEKYSFTPDAFKASTREQRKVKSDSSINHLKSDESMINANTFQKDAILKTDRGKHAIGKYLAQHITSVDMGQKCSLIVDSELHKTSMCVCLNACKCECDTTYCTPIMYKDAETAELLNEVRQKKGEAEIAVVDWYYMAVVGW